MSDASVLLLRHSPAGKRSKWSSDDRLRPLDQKGMRQAEGLAEALTGYPVKRIYSSPYKRCWQTVEPLSRKLGLPIEVEPALAEGASHREVIGFLESVCGEVIVACTHGDVVQMLVGEGEPMKKGSLWLLDSGLKPLQYRLLVP
ncbi:MAG: histidine phosphatase family protein [Actinomycetota bacterium]